MPVSSKYFANPAKQNRSRDRIEKILDITQDLAQENTKKPLEIRSIIGRAHISMGAIYHHFPSIGSLFASLMIRRITQSQSKAVDTIKNMGVNTGLIEFSTALVGVAFKDWSKTNLKVKNTAIRFFYRNAKEPELLFTYGDALIPHLDLFLQLNNTQEFKVISLEEWPLLIRAIQTSITSPFIEQLPIAGSEQHRKLAINVITRLLCRPSFFKTGVGE